MNDGAAEKKPKATRAEQASVTRQRLLAAATEVIQQDGAGSLTLDRVAAQASISKGGLLHHFATKDDLIVSLLNETLGAASDELDRRTRKYERSHGSFAFAYLDYVLDPYVEATSIASSILAAAALDEAMLADARDTFAHWQQRLIDDDGISEMAALLARIIGDGLWLIDLFDLAPPTAEQRTAVVDFVKRHIDDAGSRVDDD